MGFQELELHNVGRLLRRGKELAHLLSRGAMDADVGHRALPLRQKKVLLGHPIVLGTYFTHAGLDLALWRGMAGLVSKPGAGQPRSAQTEGNKIVVDREGQTFLNEQPLPVAALHHYKLGSAPDRVRK